MELLVRDMHTISREILQYASTGYAGINIPQCNAVVVTTILHTIAVNDQGSTTSIKLQ